jgi:hypothetical protein
MDNFTLSCYITTTTDKNGKTIKIQRFCGVKGCPGL